MPRRARSGGGGVGARAARRQAKKTDPDAARSQASSYGSIHDENPNVVDVTDWQSMQGIPDVREHEKPPKAQDFIDEEIAARKARRDQTFKTTRKQAAAARKQERKAGQKSSKKNNPVKLGMTRAEAAKARKEAKKRRG